MPTTIEDFVIDGGYPTPDTVQAVYDDLDLSRAVSMYRFFYPTVSIMATWKGNLSAGMVENKVFGILEGTPQQLVFTPNSDTPYAGLPLDLSNSPVVLELPPGPLMSTINDLNQRWVMDLGLPGPDKGQGGTHVVLPPGYAGDIPEGAFTGLSTTNRVLVLLRALPRGKDMESAIELMKSVRVYPLDAPDAPDPTWVSLTDLVGHDFTPVSWEDNFIYWEELFEVIESEPVYDAYRQQYGELAQLGIAKGQPFAPDERMRDILTRAAKIGKAQLCVQSFADRRPDRVVWNDRTWEWAVLRPENGTFDAANYVDLYAREKWFYQAQIESPAMFARAPGAGSLYWLGTRDNTGAYLDGGKSYKLTVPLPVPAKLFWSVTVYDAETRSEILTGQSKAALRSLFELSDASDRGTIDLFFGPTPPDADDTRWIKTNAGKGWFSYFRIYGPDGPAFDGSWKPGDFEVASSSDY
jgi:hypothetical protein